MCRGTKLRCGAAPLLRRCFHGCMHAHIRMLLFAAGTPAQFCSASNPMTICLCIQTDPSVCAVAVTAASRYYQKPLHLAQFCCCGIGHAWRVCAWCVHGVCMCSVCFFVFPAGIARMNVVVVKAVAVHVRQPTSRNCLLHPGQCHCGFSQYFAEGQFGTATSCGCLLSMAAFPQVAKVTPAAQYAATPCCM